MSSSTEETSRSRKGVGGRPPKYDPERTPVQAEKLCRQFGADDQALAEYFEVDVSTISRWKNEHPEFKEALRRGKDAFDTERVEQALLHRAIGYSHPEDDIRVVNGEVVITPTVRHYPPDTAAAIFWLKNRQRDRWRDKIEHDHGVQEDNPIVSLLEVIAGSTLKPKQGDD
jgi:hypothetical protein